MKLRIERDVLADAVALVARSLPVKPTVPVTAGILIEAATDGPLAGGTVTLSVFDYEVSARVELSADVVTEGRVLVSGRMLADIVKSLPSKPVDVVAEGSKVIVRCGGSKFTLLTMPADYYPSLPVMPAGSGTVDGTDMARAVGQVTAATSKDESVPILNGIRVSAADGRMVLHATDRYRLAVADLPWTGTDVDPVTVSGRTLSDLGKTLPPGPVTIGLSPDLVGFEVGHRRSTSRLVDGQYPDVMRLIPAEYVGHAVVEVEALIAAVRRVALVAEKNTPVGLAFADGRLVVSAGRGEDAQGVDEVEDVTLSGPEEFTVRLAPSYLLDGLAGVAHPYARLSFNDPVKPVVLAGQATVDGDPDGTFRYLVMPVRI